MEVAGDLAVLRVAEALGWVEVAAASGGREAPGSAPWGPALPEASALEEALKLEALALRKAPALRGGRRLRGALAAREAPALRKVRGPASDSAVPEADGLALGPGCALKAAAAPIERRSARDGGRTQARNPQRNPGRNGQRNSGAGRGNALKGRLLRKPPRLGKDGACLALVAVEDLEVFKALRPAAASGWAEVAAVSGGRECPASVPWGKAP